MPRLWIAAIKKIKAVATNAKRWEIHNGQGSNSSTNCK
jgi:hypothetical protein